MKKVVVIGSGLGGLTCASKLAKQGYEVTVLEQHFICGGYATNFYRVSKSKHKYVFDASLHGIGNLCEDSYLYNELNSLGLFKLVKPLRKKETATIIKDIDNNLTFTDIPDSFDEYLDMLIEKFPSQKEGLNKLFSFLKDLHYDMEENVHKKGFSPKYYNYLSNITLSDFLHQYISDEECIHMFNFLWLYYGSDPNTLSALYYLLPWVSYHIGHTYYIEGGAQKLSNSLKEIIESTSSDSKVICNEEVTEILFDENDKKKVIGVKTKKGHTYYCDILVCNNCVYNLKNLSNNEFFNSLINKKTKNYEEGISLTQLYIGLDTLPQNIGLTKSDYFIDTFKNNDYGFSYIENNDYEHTPIAIVNYNLLDPNLNKDVGYICVTLGDRLKFFENLTDEEYRSKKDKIIQILLKRVDKYFPEVKNHIDFLDLATPKTMYRYTKNKGGAVYGFSQNIVGSGFNRMYNKIEDTNVYISSAYSQPGGGYEGAIMSGLITSKIISYEVDKYKKVVETKVNTKDSNLTYLSVDCLFKGMILNAKRENINYNCIYKFVFKDIDKIKLVEFNKDKKKARILKEKHLKNRLADITITVNYSDYFLLSMERVHGNSLVRQNKMQIDGDFNLFQNFIEVFTDTGHGNETETYAKENKKEVETKKPIKESCLYIFLNLLPYILLWSTYDFIKNDNFYLIYVLLGVQLLFSIFTPFIRGFKQLRKYNEFDKFNIYTFSLTLIFVITCFLLSLENSTIKLFYFALPNVLLFSYFVQNVINNIGKHDGTKLITGIFSKNQFYDNVTSSKLFYKINFNLTLMWTIIFLAHFITSFALHNLFETPLISLVYLIDLGGILASVIYPKLMMK